MGTTDEYNGWTNRATWLVNLWVTNDEPTYRLLEFTKPNTPKLCEFFVKNVISRKILYSIKNDMGEHWNLSDVNWEEICEAWNEE